MMDAEALSADQLALKLKNVVPGVTARHGACAGLIEGDASKMFVIFVDIDNDEQEFLLGLLEEEGRIFHLRSRWTYMFVFKDVVYNILRHHHVHVVWLLPAAMRNACVRTPPLATRNPSSLLESLNARLEAYRAEY